MLTQILLILCFVSYSSQIYQNNTILTLYSLTQIDSAVDDPPISNFLKPPFRKTFQSHCDISSETDPVVEGNFGPFIGLINEVDNDIALVGFLNQQIKVDDVGSLCQHVFESEAILEMTIAVVGTGCGEGVTLEGEGHGVVDYIWKI